jgi:hypothetical protein
MGVNIDDLTYGQLKEIAALFSVVVFGLNILVHLSKFEHLLKEL